MNTAWEEKMEKCIPYTSEKCPGIRQHIIYELGAGIIPMPADTSLYAIFVMKGVGQYEGIRVKAGDVVVLGLNRQPITGISENMTLFILTLDFTLFYDITGILPGDLEGVMHLGVWNPLSELSRILIEFPQNCWRRLADNYLSSYLAKRHCVHSLNLERVHYISNKILQSSHTYRRPVNILPAGYNTAQYENENYLLNYQKSYKDVHRIARDAGLSPRQIERNFKQVLGMTPKEYQQIVRFQHALGLLRDNTPSQAAILAGYYDQSHMTKDFARFSPWTPVKCAPVVSSLLPYQ